MKNTINGLGLGLGLAVGALVALAPGSPAASAEFQVDRDASRVYIKVDSSGRLGHKHGMEGQLESGKITLGESGKLVFAMKTFRADTPEARQYVGVKGSIPASDRKKVAATMHGPTVLDVTRFPTAEYTIASAIPADGGAPGEPGKYKLDGRLTLHGVTRPLPLVAQVDRTATAGVLRMRCSFAIQQSDFGITPYSTLGGLVGVADRLEIWGDLTIRPSSQ